MPLGGGLRTGIDPHAQEVDPESGGEHGWPNGHIISVLVCPCEKRVSAPGLVGHLSPIPQGFLPGLKSTRQLVGCRCHDDFRWELPKIDRIPLGPTVKDAIQDLVGDLWGSAREHPPTDLRSSWERRAVNDFFGGDPCMEHLVLIDIDVHAQWVTFVWD